MSAPPTSEPDASAGQESRSGKPGGVLQSARQRMRQLRELEEQRRYGLAPLAVDEEASRRLNKTVEISPNVPGSMTQAPWFYGISGPTLEHQRVDPNSRIGKRAADRHSAALKGKEDAPASALQKSRPSSASLPLAKPNGFVPGACHNCGSLKHQTAQCYYPKRKVPAKYSGQMTAKPLPSRLTAASVTPQVVDEASSAVEEAEGLSAPLPQKRKMELFSTTSVQHGGVEIKPVPKYLRNMDAMLQGQVFFDARTGSMRGNPNAAVTAEGDNTVATLPLKTYEGDLANYQTEDYYAAVDQQYRFMTGTSQSFVDFEYDVAKRLLSKIRDQLVRQEDGEEEEEEALHPDETAGVEDVGDIRPETFQAVAAALGIPFPLSEAFLSRLPAHLRNPVLQSAATEDTAGVESTATTRPVSSASRAVQGAAYVDVVRSFLEATSNDRGGKAEPRHRSAYGSYYDTATSRWGYKCCHQLEKESACTSSMNV